MAPQHAGRGERQHVFVVGVERGGGDQQRDQHDPKPAMPMPRWPIFGVSSGPTQPDTAAKREQRHGDEVVAEQRGDADHREQHRQIEREGREFAAPGRSRRSSHRAWRASGSGPCADRRGRPPVAAFGTTTSWSGSMSRLSLYICCATCLGLAEAALLHQPHRGLRHVMAHEQDDRAPAGRRARA